MLFCQQLCNFKKEPSFNSIPMTYNKYQGFFCKVSVHHHINKTVTATWRYKSCASSLNYTNLYTAKQLAGYLKRPRHPFSFSLPFPLHKVACSAILFSQRVQVDLKILASHSNKYTHFFWRVKKSQLCSDVFYLKLQLVPGFHSIIVFGMVNKMHILKHIIEKKEEKILGTLNPIAWWSLLNLKVNKNARKLSIQKHPFYTNQILNDQIFLFLQQLVIKWPFQPVKMFLVCPHFVPIRRLTGF